MAERFLERLIGLIGTRRLEQGHGLLFPRCNDIHMWFMSIPIDVVFLRTEKAPDGRVIARVTSAHEQVRPWRALPLHDTKATDTLELPAGTIGRCGIGAGDELCIS